MKYFKVDCEWCTNDGKPDAAGNSENGWSGILWLEGLQFRGTVKDNGADQDTHYMSGAFDPEIGVSFIKFNLLNTHYDPITFSAVKTKKDNEYVGKFDALTLFGTFNMGHCKITIEELTLTEEEGCAIFNNSLHAGNIIRKDEFYDEIYSKHDIPAVLKEKIEHLKPLLEENLSNPYSV